MKSVMFLVAISLLGALPSSSPLFQSAPTQSGPPNNTSGKNEVEKRVDQVFAVYGKRNSPGCSVGVIENGDFVYRNSYGMGSLELGVPLSSQSVFYMGSVSKQFTAASIVLAAEQGFLNLDDDVHKYIPELPVYGQPVTLRQMLHHTSGIPDLLTMPAKSASVSLANPDGPVSAEMRLEGWTKIAGVLFATHRTNYHSGVKLAEMTDEETIRINAGLTPSELAAKPADFAPVIPPR